jgi:predicted TIM-barrel fold metal-dependent hydrolase
MIPIVDAHHHIWRQSDLAWLNPPMQPRIFGPYESIMRDYLIDEYINDIKGHNVMKSVYVQTNWPIDKAVEEVDWVESCAKASDWPMAITAYCNLLGEDVDTDLSKLANSSNRMRGIRMQLHWHENPQFRFADSPDIYNESKFRSNLARIQQYGWLFELQVFPGQMVDAAALINQFPDINFVLVHAGMAEEITGQVFHKWKEGISRLADCSNCFVKISGLGTFSHLVSIDIITAISMTVIELFGADRCVFGSNFPIEKIWSTYDELISAYQSCLSGLSEQEQQQVFHDTADKLYGLS